MLKTSKDSLQYQPIPPPDVNVIMYDRVMVTCDWSFTRQLPFWLLYYNPSPGARLIFEKQTLNPDGEQLVLIPPRTLFQSCCEAPFEHLYLHFTAGAPYTLVRSEPIVFSRRDCPLLQQVLCVPHASTTLIYAFLLATLSQIPETCFSTQENAPDNRVQKALSLLGGDLSNEEIARSIGMSPSNFQRLFKQEIGMAPKHYAMLLRLERARCWLMKSQSSIEDIARACKFADRYAFSKAFKHYFGTTPARCRSSSHGEAEKE